MAPYRNLKTDNVPLAIGAILLTAVALSLGDAVIKFTSGTFVVWQVFVVRSLMLLPVLVLWVVARHGIGRLRFATPYWTAMRSLALVFMWLAYYLALPHLEFSVAAASYYTLPLFITLFSAAFTGARVGPLGWLAVGLGFVGVVLILRPDAGDFNSYAVLPLISAMLYAAAMILTRTRCLDEPPVMLSLGLNLMFVLIGGLATACIAALPGFDQGGRLTADWAVMDVAAWGTMGMLALAVLIGSIGAGIAYQNAPSSMIGTFDFTYVGFAVVWGIVFFAQIPDSLTVVGMCLIVLAGILSLRR